MLGTSLGSIEIVQTARDMGYYTIVTDNLEPEQSNAKNVLGPYAYIHLCTKASAVSFALFLGEICVSS